ncbi:restriction endonuclease subunit S [Stenomitos frigidus]|uniref:Type I restriction modification DNA specificity domain-containing protein n=1 Tax=Stenomitos frigidus ULC18 TaxID=2107698 RepID=A0A2T1E2T6_9CYAN|nr:restriction endonuclease subunit S [Stenomitos frigidus]PSB27059.1 hypothetical protein C7B82_18110 [Stenomitos frigidus ULC18]
MSDELIELPERWEETTLGQIVLGISYGHTASSTETPVGPKFLRITDLQNNSVDWDTVPYCECDSIEKYKLKKGDIVVARTGATTGKSFLIQHCPEPTVFASCLIRLQTSTSCSPDYLAAFMQSDNYWKQITTVSKGTAQPGVNASILATLSVPLPPLNEQKRIVAKIEELRERSQKARSALSAIPNLCDKFRQSVLAAAFRGDLTADWRKQNPDFEPASVLLERVGKDLGQNLADVQTEIDRTDDEIPSTWAWAKLKLMIKKIQPGNNFLCPEVPVTETTVGLVKISAVTWGTFNPKETKTVADPSKVDPNLFIQPVTFLLLVQTPWIWSVRRLWLTRFTTKLC